MDNNTLENGIVVQPCEWGVVGVVRKWFAPEDNAERAVDAGIEVTRIGKAVVGAPYAVTTLRGHVVNSEETIDGNVEATVAIGPFIKEELDVVGFIRIEADDIDVNHFPKSIVGPTNIAHDSTEISS